MRREDQFAKTFMKLPLGVIVPRDRQFLHRRGRGAGGL